MLFGLEKGTLRSLMLLGFFLAFCGISFVDAPAAGESASPPLLNKAIMRRKIKKV